MNDTYLMHYEDPRISVSVGLSHRHFDFSQSDPSLGNIDVDAAQWNTSLDFAGGGLVSTASDIDKFYRGLFSDKLISDSNIVGDAEFRVMGDAAAPYYGLGFSLNLDPVTNEVLSYEHGGFWGSYMAYFPKRGTSVVFTANQVEHDSFDLLLSTLHRLF